MAELSLTTLFSMPKLRRTWKQLRKELARTGTRDCIDYLDIDTDSERWLSKTRKVVLSGAYTPQHPAWFEVAKRNGAYRTVTRPALRDILVFRHICDGIYDVACAHEPPGAFFSRRHGPTKIGKKVDSTEEEGIEYAGFFEVWMRYKAYRERVGLTRPHRVVVVSDISNYFDSVQHALLIEQLAPYGLARQTLGLLGRFLDILRPPSGDSPTPAVGLPVDEFECSRTLAHIFLFEHDRRMERMVGNASYVRWMDDQTFGVTTKTIGRKVVRGLVGSLGSQRLTVNSGKTKILAPDALAKEFHIELNNKIDDMEKSLGDAPAAVALVAAGSTVSALWAELDWQRASGHWDKVAKRLLAWAARTNVYLLKGKRAGRLLVKEPILAERVFEYLLAQDRWGDYLDLFEGLLRSGNSLYEDVEAHWFEMALRSDPSKSQRTPLRKLAVEFATKTKRGTQLAGPRVPAALLLYWLGDGRNWRRLRSILAGDVDLDGPTRRTLAAVLCAVKPADTDSILLSASRQASPQVSGFVEWMLRLRAGEELQLTRPLVAFRRPPSITHEVLDARGWLRLELLSCSPRADVQRMVKADVARARKLPGGQAQKVIGDRIAARLGP
ncbi:MAG: RNA-directed DNA polymerase [Kofleriaceae bacterium]